MNIDSKNKCVSIIIPVYNMERLVRKSVESALCQTYRNVDVIVIDDGSTDKSSDIVDELGAVDERVTVIHQSNQGIAAAIETGLKKAQGEYLIFLDSDDYIDPDMIDRLMLIHKETNADIVHCGLVTFYTEEGVDIVQQTDKSIKMIYRSNKEVLDDFFIGKRVKPNLAQKLFKRSLFDGVDCTVCKQSIDTVIMLQVLFKCSIYVVTNELLYYRYKREKSISNNKITDERWKDFIKAEKFYHRFLKKEGSMYMDYIYFRHLKCFLETYNAVYASDIISNKREKLILCKKYFKKYYPMAVIGKCYKSQSIVFKLKTLLFRISPYIECKILSVRRWVG